MNIDEPPLNELSQRAIGCALTVAGTLGSGFAEKVYENSLAHELRKYGLVVTQQRGATVWYDGVIVGEYTIDLSIADALLVELKVVRGLETLHWGQCLNYLMATGFRLCLLFNFGASRLEIKRIVNGL